MGADTDSDMEAATPQEEKRGDFRELMAMAEMRARLYAVSRRLSKVLPDQLANIAVGYANDTRAYVVFCKMLDSGREVVIEFGAIVLTIKNVRISGVAVVVCKINLYGAETILASYDDVWDFAVTGWWPALSSCFSRASGYDGGWDKTISELGTGLGREIVRRTK